MLNIYTQNNSSTPITPENDKKAKNGKAPKAPSFMAYQDPTGEFASKELKRGLWLAAHQVLLHRLAVIGLVIFIALVGGFGVYKWIKFVFFDLSRDTLVAERLANFTDFTQMHPHFAPQPITIIGTRILPGGVDKYDVVAEVANLNPLWRVSLDYFFTIDGATTTPQRATLIPGEQRPLAFFGISSTGAPGSAELTLQNVSWQRVSSKNIVNPVEWQAERLRFVTDKFEFLPPGSVDGADAAIIRFTLANQTSYGYAAPSFYVGLLAGDDLVGLMPLEIPKFESLETRNIDMRSFAPSLGVTGVKVFPLIDVYDNSVYLPPPT